MLISKLAKSLNIDHEPVPEQPKGWKKIALFIIYLFVVILTAGVIIGYQQLSPILQDAGFFNSSCNYTEYEENNCTSQIEALDDLFNTGASVSIFIQVLAGAMLDFLGPKLTCWSGLLLLGPGSIMMAFAKPGNDLITPAFVLLSAGGPLAFVSTMHVGALFPDKSGLIMSLLNGCYSGGALIFFVFNELFYKYDIDLEILFLSYAGLMCLFFLLSIAFWPWFKYVPQVTDYISIQDVEDNVDESTKDYLKDLFRRILTLDFLYIFLFIPVIGLAGNFFLSTSNQQILLVTPDLDEYAKILSWLIPTMGFAIAPFGLLADKLGISFGITFLIFVFITSQVCSLFKITALLVIRFVLFSIWYPFTYALWASYLIVQFKHKYYGSLFAVVALATGLVNFAADSLVQIGLSNPEENFRWINIALIIAIGVFLIYPLIDRGSYLFKYRRTALISK